SRRARLRLLKWYRERCRRQRCRVAPMRDEIEARLRSFFSRPAADVAAAYLFGSVARGEGRPASDVDVAVLYRDTPPPTLDGLHLETEGALEDLLGRPVQLVVLNSAPPDLVHRVLRDGRLVHES